MIICTRKSRDVVTEFCVLKKPNLSGPKIGNVS